MKHPTRKRLELLGIAGVICIVGLFCACGVADRDEMLRLTLIWGRLAPLPATAQNFTITEEGNMFTRSFRASFIAPVADVERWLRESPGTLSHQRDLHRRLGGSLISPGDGAQHAEVTVDDSSGAVRIYVSWS